MNLLKAVAVMLVPALFSLALQTPVMAAEATLLNPKLLEGYQPPRTSNTVANQPKPAAEKKEWTKGGKIMTGIGLAIAGTGAVMMTRKTSEDAGLNVNWRATGGIWMGGGAVLVLIGLTRRH